LNPANRLSPARMGLWKSDDCRGERLLDEGHRLLTGWVREVRERLGQAKNSTATD